MMLSPETDARAFYTTHSPITDPHGYAFLFHGLPEDVLQLCRVQQGLVIHLGLGDLYGWPVPAARRPEAELRGVAAILAHIHQRNPKPLTVARSPQDRFVGHCRVSTVLLCAMLRAQGIAACARAGFMAYHGGGWTRASWDHWICEYWNADAHQWMLVDPELDATLQATLQVTFDPCDIPRERFLTAGQAWLACRTQGVDPLLFGLDPADAGLDYVRAQLLRDLAALNKWEAGGADKWGLSGQAATALSEDDLALLDHVAIVTSAGAAAFTEVRTLYMSNPCLRPTLD